MKNKLIGIGLIMGIFMLWPFSCVPQTVKIEDGCDTVVIESPQLNQGLKDCQQMVEDLTALNNDLTAQNKSLQTDLSAAGVTIQQQGDQILQLTQQTQDLTAQRDGLQQDLLQSQKMVGDLTAQNTDLTDQNKALQSDLTAAGVTIQQQGDRISQLTQENQDLTLQKGDLITQRDELQALLDQCRNQATEIIDTVWATTCFKSPEMKVWFHAGEMDVYPHRIYFPTEEFEFIGVMFTDSLTQDQKKYQTRFKLERKRDLQRGVTTYKNLFVDPAEYMPEN